MAKPIIVSLSGKEYSFSPTKIERTKIYGAKKRVALDAQERFCIRASLTSDGAHLMQSGMTAQGYFITRLESFRTDYGDPAGPQIVRTDHVADPSG